MTPFEQTIAFSLGQKELELIKANEEIRLLRDEIVKLQEEKNEEEEEK